MLKLRFGIEDGRTRTLEEVGKEFNVTRERILPDRGQGPPKAAPSQQEQEAEGLFKLTGFQRSLKHHRRGA